MNGLLKYFLATLTTAFFCVSVRAEMEVARINDKDGFTNIREGQGTEFKVVGTVTSDDFFYCDQSNSDWWKVTALKLRDRAQQIHEIQGYIFKDRVQFLSSLPDRAKQKLILTIFVRQEKYAKEFQAARKSKDSLAYRTTVRALENFSDMKYSPILPIFSDYFCKTKDTLTLKQFFATTWADKGSANEMPSFAYGDCFTCHSDIVLQQLKRVRNKEQLRSIVNHIEWGLRDHFNVPEEGLGIPDNANKKEVDDFNKLMIKLKTIQL